MFYYELYCFLSCTFRNGDDDTIKNCKYVTYSQLPFFYFTSPVRSCGLLRKPDRNSAIVRFLRNRKINFPIAIHDLIDVTPFRDLKFGLLDLILKQ